MYAVTVTFRIAPGRMTEFLLLVLENAKTSKRAEPGCRQFDVLTDPAQPDTVFLYELYDTRRAFDRHLASEHFRHFDADVAAMVDGKDVQTWESVA